MKRSGLCILVCLLVPPVLAQEDTTGLSSLIVHDAKMALSGAIHVVTSPGRWDCVDWTLAGATAGITAGAVILDADMRVLMQRQRNAGAADGLSDLAKTYGDGWFAVGLTAGLYGTGLVIRDPWLRETAVLAGTAIIVSTVVTRVIKPVVGGHGRMSMPATERSGCSIWRTTIIRSHRGIQWRHSHCRRCSQRVLIIPSRQSACTGWHV